jgi:hypothetical protein
VGTHEYHFAISVKRAPNIAQLTLQKTHKQEQTSPDMHSPSGTITKSPTYAGCLNVDPIGPNLIFENTTCAPGTSADTSLITSHSPLAGPRLSGSPSGEYVASSHNIFA